MSSRFCHSPCFCVISLSVRGKTRKSEGSGRIYYLRCYLTHFSTLHCFRFVLQFGTPFSHWSKYRNAAKIRRDRRLGASVTDQIIWHKCGGSSICFSKNKSLLRYFFLSSSNFRMQSSSDSSYFYLPDSATSV